MLTDDLKAIVGPKGWTTSAADLEPHLTERRGVLRGRTLIMVSPDTTQQVARVVAACAAAGVSLVPQGGNTGLCGGAIPDQSGEQVLLSMSRLNRIRRVDPDDFSMTVEAGCILANAQQAAHDAKRLFPLSLAAEGSCQIGGNLSTNAGGINVIRYGTARQQVLGLEVVLADGTIWDGLRSLRKDAGGYDMKQVFLGSEGTLGVITAATLRLFPEHAQTRTALLGIPSAQAAIKLLARMRAACADRLLAFELMSDTAYRMSMRNSPRAQDPLSASHPWYLLMEAASDTHASDVDDALAAAIDDGDVQDAVVAKNTGEANALWRIRHGISEAQRSEGVSLKHDISVPIARIGDFMARAREQVLEVVPEARLVVFGHVGDGNLHYNISQPRDADAETFRQVGSIASDRIYALVQEMNGSFSAEHGVGIFKKDLLAKYRSETEVRLMRTLKRALDPKNTLNPGKVI